MKKIKNSSKGFTLLELLVVVLIIGILAAIALPQYQMAVGKAKFSTLKSLTKSMQSAAQRYYLTHNTYSGVNNGLDIEKPKDSSCYITESVDQVYCSKNIFNTNIYYYVKKSTGKPLQCMTLIANETDKANRLCKQETGNRAHCDSDRCIYYY